MRLTKGTMERMDTNDKMAKKKADAEAEVAAAIAAMPEADKRIGERLHLLIKENAPDLAPKTWYGMPAYAKDNKVICFFRSRQKFKERYMTLGFNDGATLDDGALWSISFAITDLTEADEEKIKALIKKAAG